VTRIDGVDLGAIARREDHALAKVVVKGPQPVRQCLAGEGELLANGYGCILMI
jgi:hypothetical protein